MKPTLLKIALLLSLSCLQQAEATSCGVPNKADPEEQCPDCDNPSGDSGSGAQGPSPSAASTTATCELDYPSRIIGANHGGALLHTTDLEISGAVSGLPLSFTRYYNSRDAETSGDLMGHGRTWSHSLSWRMAIAGSSRRIFFPSGRMLEFAPTGSSTYLGQASSLYTPVTGNGERLHNIGNFWYMVVPGGAVHIFERVVRSDGAVLYHPRSSKDTRGNTLTYTSNTAARITKVADAAANSITLTYAQETINRRAAVNLHTITTPPVVGWNEVIIPAGASFRWIQAVSASVAYFDVSEIKFYKSNGSGGYTLLGGTAYGTGPAIDDGPNTFDKVFDGSGSTRFTFCRPNAGIAGLDLGASGAASVTKIRYYIMGMFSGDLDKFVGTRRGHAGATAKHHRAHLRHRLHWPVRAVRLRHAPRCVHRPKPHRSRKSQLP